MNWFRYVLYALFLSAVSVSTVSAGMPAPLPTWYTLDQEPDSAQVSIPAKVNPLQLQAISFFAALLALSAKGTQSLWNRLRHDFPSLPLLTYFAALRLVLLWGALFVVILAMISGARELMTPGAWQKTGWTYRLQQQPDSAQLDLQTRRQILEDLRFTLWNYALQNSGNLPADKNTPFISSPLWEHPDPLSLPLVYVPGQSVGDPKRIIVVEPERIPQSRLVLWGDGHISEESSETIRNHWPKTTSIPVDVESTP